MWDRRPTGQCVTESRVIKITLWMPPFLATSPFWKDVSRKKKIVIILHIPMKYIFGWHSHALVHLIRIIIMIAQTLHMKHSQTMESM